MRSRCKLPMSAALSAIPPKPRSTSKRDPGAAIASSPPSIAMPTLPPTKPSTPALRFPKHITPPAATSISPIKSSARAPSISFSLWAGFHTSNTSGVNRTSPRSFDGSARWPTSSYSISAAPDSPTAFRSLNCRPRHHRKPHLLQQRSRDIRLRCRYPAPSRLDVQPDVRFPRSPAGSNL